MNIKELLHKRVLVAVKATINDVKNQVREIKILEISPSQNWVKIMNDVGKKYWIHYSDITPIEVLESLTKDKPIEK